MTNYGRWLRFAGSRVYHRTGADYIRRGKSLCERLDLTRTGFELIKGDETEPNDTRYHRCKRCLAVLSYRKDLQP